MNAILRRFLIFILICFVSEFAAAQPVPLGTVGKAATNFVTSLDRIWFSSNDSLFSASVTDGSIQFLKKANGKIIHISELTSENRIYFVAESGAQQTLWYSSGTTETTNSIGTFKSIRPLIEYNGSLFLAIDDGTTGRELWKLSGLTLSLLKDISPGVLNGFNGDLIKHNNLLYFKGSGNIWRTDGTTAGTVLAVNVSFGDWNKLTSVGDVLYFARSYSGSIGQVAELWKAVGSNTSPTLVRRYNSGQLLNELYHLTAYQGKLYYVHKDEYIYSLKSTDGITISLVKKLGIDGSVPMMAKGFDRLFFNAEIQYFLGELLSYDGTSVTRVHAFSYYTSPDRDNIQIPMTDDRIYIVDAPPNGGWRGVIEIDPVTNTSVVITEKNGEPFKNAGSPVASPNTFYFTAGVGTRTLWAYQRNIPEPVCSNTGGITREWWNHVSGNQVSQIPLANTPTGTEVVTSLQGPTNIGDRYGSRYRGYICPPETGTYQFSIASNDQGELWISTTENPADRVRVAWVEGFTNPGQYTKYPTQRSGPIILQKGMRYYIEVLHKEGMGTDHISVAWTTPAGETESPIEGKNLIPFNSIPQETGTILREVWNGITGSQVSSIPLASVPTTTQELNLFEGPTNSGTQYGSRIRGWVVPPVSGQYRFYISSNDNSELWLSNNSNPSGKVMIASVVGATNVRQWDKFMSQQSAWVNLNAGERYYIEALHKQGVGTDHVAVGWDLPGGIVERPIPGMRLIPWSGVESLETMALVSEASVMIHPNPSTDRRVYLELDNVEGAESIVNVTVRSMLGEVVYTAEWDRSLDPVRLDLQLSETLTPGVYFISGKGSKTSFTQRLILK